MTNTPMTFEEWLKTKECDANYGFHRLSEYRTNMCKEVWQASQAQQSSVIAEWEKLKDANVLHTNLLRGLPAKLSDEQLLHLLGSEHPLNKQAQTIAELVEALDLLTSMHSNSVEVNQWKVIALQAIAKVKGK